MLAGMNRKRKNAVNKDVRDEEVSAATTPTGKRPRGRPSKGGEAMRAKRYYVKKHLLILQKRKLRRYFLKVRKIMADKQYNAAAVKKDLEEFVSQYKNRDNKTATRNDILQAVDLAREDRYLSFLNQEANSMLDLLPSNDTTSCNTTDENTQIKIEKLMLNLANKHSGRLFQLTTLWSAYLLLYHVEKEFDSKETDLNDVEKLEKIQATCLDYYELDYSHLKGEELPDALNGSEEGEDGESSERAAVATPQAEAEEAQEEAVENSRDEEEYTTNENPKASSRTAKIEQEQNEERL